MFATIGDIKTIANELYPTAIKVTVQRVYHGDERGTVIVYL
jgi:hypothetical protein